ncbi:MAG: hypothetical protein ACYSYV_06350 [Planctomycetota bacterium]|jgi:porphobilinogen synthase
MENTHRLKRTKNFIQLTREAQLSIDDLVYPMFIAESSRADEALPGLPYYTLETALHACEEACKLGIPGIMIFDIVDTKDDKGMVALNDNLFTAKIFRTLKKEFGSDLLLITNTGICSYRKDGSCIDYDSYGNPLIEETCDVIGKIAAAHASFGADMISLPEMVDGQVRYTRESLHVAGFDHIPTMSLVKGDSCLFKPWEKAMGKKALSIPSFTFRIDPSNWKMFKRKIAVEVGEGVDIITIKPASTYLDIVRYANESYCLPVGAYQVSGEYVMLKSLAEKTLLGETDLVIESLQCIKRAGASIIMTYFALEIARLLYRQRNVISK